MKWLAFFLPILALMTAIPVSASPNDPETTAGPSTGLLYPEGTTVFYGDNRVFPDSCECLDLVLIIDDTGSMADAISNVQSGILDILALAEETCGSVQAGLITFKDDIEVDVPFTFDLSQVSSAINALGATGGSWEPEASDEALREALTSTVCALTGDFDSSAWRDGCCKVTVLVTDANPGGCDDEYVDGVDDVNAHLRALEAASMGISIGAIFVPTFGDPGGTITPIMLDYASTTGGVYGQTATDGNGTASAIEQIILNCVGTASTEICCLSEDCLVVLEGTCETIGGFVVDSCDVCEFSPTEEASWGSIKSSFSK
jgi:uncharacterized protein YegL